MLTLPFQSVRRLAAVAELGALADFARHMTLAPHIKYLWAGWGVVTVLLSASALDVWSKCCACGYQTPRGLFTSVTLAAVAWIGFFLPHSRFHLVRVPLDLWAIYTTALLGKHLADVLWLSPHAPFDLW